MLADPKKIVIPGQVGTIQMLDTTSGGFASDQVLQLGLIDLAPGKSVRCGTLADGRKATLTISHSVSNENKGTLTDRAAIRLDIRKNVEGIGGVTAQATLTTSTPRDGFATSDVRALVTSLMSAIMASDATDMSGTDGVTLTMSNGDDTLNRVLNGEP